MRTKWVSSHSICTNIFKAYSDDILELKMKKYTERMHTHETLKKKMSENEHEQQEQIVYVLVRLNYFTSGNTNVFSTK